MEIAATEKTILSQRTETKQKKKIRKGFLLTWILLIFNENGNLVFGILFHLWIYSYCPNCGFLFYRLALIYIFLCCCLDSLHNLWGIILDNMHVHNLKWNSEQECSSKPGYCVAFYQWSLMNYTDPYPWAFWLNACFVGCRDWGRNPVHIDENNHNR